MLETRCREKLLKLQAEMIKTNINDFYIYQFDSGWKLVLAGSFDFNFCYYHDIEIEFIEVSFISCPVSLFKIDTIRLATEEERKSISQLSRGYNEGIAFCLEHVAFNNTFYIVAKGIDYKLQRVYYLPKRTKPPWSSAAHSRSPATSLSTCESSE
ncbi:hypothetical protein LQV63_25925 [Paenibacillus profundus]|uniref:Uncharacterized protein n=1 Tax=Paenibacillus profundus TaxID=1173085 RepID=A0ABS8YMC9_9BACL|nr:hypothetical protein [Paenibacillus profundus]MCE5172712.1 hypothetical protein [Paenibacillus profundus]